MKSVLTFEIEWKPTPAGDIAPCHLCDFKAVRTACEPCSSCLSDDDKTCLYPVIAKSDILPW